MAEGGERFNVRNPAVKRILQEVKELQNNPNDDYVSMPLEDNIFEWQFAIRGPKDTEFEGGIYHGRIQLPPEYPLKPPEFVLLTPNGRFETKTKICLSISAHHPEFWQPSWSVRTALVALIAFMPTKPEGAIGSLDYTKEERRALAIKSRDAAPRVSTPERQKLIDEIHVEMMKRAHPVPDTKESPPEDAENNRVEVEATPSPASRDLAPAPALDPAPALAPVLAPAPALIAPAPATINAVNPPPPPAAVAAIPAAGIRAGRSEEQAVQQSSDFGLTALAIGLAIAIVGILVRKALRYYGYVI
ncbi:ubiquitin-conjugating enzyme 32, E2 [Selaginella moellendorffii]|uniref:Ubiquitin-conjugating enzyme 32, E2 n=1 Tax=Selaginella moellendorffii TaxID=88036 RepID=D8SPL9_SELML|nr:ubiquitin-conjugating enzyme E2 32 [Selaginella moellendorffii]EFJ13805.1 ubiquitin-conjugating enzyme 32, E2 [Selaginella moellendorffii]|eukprot:XP_002985311.1 ubiquitin-conjugating enzyme E2 32 [Selaginella moellendorffii]